MEEYEERRHPPPPNNWRWVAPIVIAVLMQAGTTIWWARGVSEMHEDLHRRVGKVEQVDELISRRQETVLAEHIELMQRVKGLESFATEGKRFTKDQGDAHDNRIKSLEEWRENGVPPAWLKEMVYQLRAELHEARGQVQRNTALLEQLLGHGKTRRPQDGP